MGWTCEACTFVNEKEAYLSCEVCGAERSRKRDFTEAFAKPRGRQPAWGDDLPVCEVGDVVECRRLLDEHGAVVFRAVASREDLAAAERLFWHWLEANTGSRSISLAKLGYANTGVVTNFSIGQSAFLWRCRELALPAWRTVWDCHDLVSSFDGCGLWPNGVHTDGKWYHLDQNFAHNPGFLGYQGLLNFFDQTGQTGSTVVVPGSHRDFRSNCERSKHNRGSFVRLDNDLCDATAVQVAPVGPGDVVIWDARTVHCSAGVDRRLPPDHRLNTHPKPPLARLVAYVAMMPRSRVTPRVAAARRNSVIKGSGSGWNPLVMRRDSSNTSRHYRPPDKAASLWSLV